MGIFDKLNKKKSQSTQIEKHFEHELLEIVRIVSFDDADVLKVAQDCIDKTMEYYENHVIEYEERGLSNEEEVSFLQWIGCIDLLIKNNYVCECDWKETKESFISQILALHGIRSLSLKINSKWFDEKQDIANWCEELNKRWEKNNSVIAAFDMDSDSYVMFICKKAELEILSVLAENFGYRIDYAKNM